MNMPTIGLFEAKQKLSEIVERASAGERIGITCRGKLAAVLVPAAPAVTLDDVFREIELIRRKVKRHKKVSIRQLIEEGRR